MAAKAIGYWVSTGLAAVAFAGSGVGNLAHAPNIAQDMAHLGYPTYFLAILGSWKILGAITVVIPAFPRLKEWAYAGMMFDLTGAAASRAAAGDGAAKVLVPLLIAAVVVASWALRPEGRALRSPSKSAAPGRPSATGRRAAA